MNRKQRKAKLRAARARQKRHHNARTKSASRDQRQLATVEGESAAALIAALAKIRINTDHDGSTTFDVALSPEEMVPVMRAFMRIEAELLIEDAAALVDMADEQRSESERHADAFALLVQRTCTVAVKQKVDNRMICNSYEL